MSDRTLGKARGLNSIADPSDFKGSRGRRTRPGGPDGPTETHPTTGSDRQPIERTVPGPGGAAGDHTAGDHAAGHHAAGDQKASVGDRRRSGQSDDGGDPRTRRKRRELSIPVPVADALTDTGINPADVVMTAYRKFADSIYAGTGGRLVSRGRERLRLSISDGEFDKITRLGQARGWNRSETVAVLLTMELLDDPTATTA